MTLIELSDDQAALLEAKAAAHGLTLEGWLGKLAEEEDAQTFLPQIPLEFGRDRWANHAPAPSTEDIDEDRSDIFRGFGEDF